MLTTGKGTHYCVHCGYDMKPKEERECTSCDGDLCEPRKRVGPKNPPVIETPRYRIEGDSFVDIATKLVYLMKTEREESPDSHVNKIQLCMRDGSKVTVQLSKTPADGSARRGIEIDGARLG